ncbi:MAG: helix-turn-helix domain-containing protein [Candidatus Berkiella sp.]
MKGSTPISVLIFDRRVSTISDSHQHKEGQLFLITDGLLILDTPFGRQTLPAKRAGWIPPNCIHSAKSIGPIKAISLYFNVKTASLLPTTPCVFTPNPLLQEIIIRFSNTSNKSSTTASQKHLLALMKEELKSIQTEPLFLPMPHNLKLEKMALQFIKNPNIEKSLEQWALSVNMSKRSFTRHFRQETGMSFAKWCQQACIAHALQLLQKKRPVSDIAFELGYESVSAFIKVFKQFVGQTPHQCGVRHQN